MRAVVAEKTRGDRSHPDVIVIERGLYEPSAMDGARPRRRSTSIDQVRTLVLAHAAVPPHEGRAKVFVVRRAEELSTAAANALLKTLEEPIARTHFILLSAQPDALLPTIRSRTQRVRFGPLPEGAIAKLLAARGVDAFAAGDVARLAGGSMSVALGLADADELQARAAFVERALGAIDAATLGPALDLAEDAKKEKGDLATRLEALASALAARASKAAGEPTRDAEIAAARHGMVLAALVQLGGNASAQLVVESMLIKMRSA